jgi:ABC-type transporter MlaC component
MGGKVFKIVLDQSTGEDEKEQAFIGLLDQYFDMDEIAKYLMGSRTFKTLTTDQKTRYQKALKFYIAHLYLVKFETYQRHDFDPKMFHVGRAVAKGDKKGSFSVQSTINVNGSSGREPLEVEWTVVPGNVPGGTLKIQDAYVAGISMLITKKDEFKSIIAQGVETFLSKLEDMAHH